ncbi:MAG: T9SS type A sorting domain-containing protein [Chitinophagales bacterium]
MRQFISTLLIALTLSVGVSFGQYTPYFIDQVNTTGATGEPDSSGVLVELRGIVGSGNFRPPGLLFAMEDSTGGISVFSNANNFGYTAARGDLVVVRGEIDFFNGLTQVIADTVFSVGTPNITAAVYDQELGEDVESQFVRLNCLVLDPSDWPSAPSGSGFNVDATDNAGNTFVIRIDNDTELFSAAAPTADTVDIQGTVGQFTFNAPYNTGYQLQPYYTIDITASPAGQCVNLVTYPDATIGAVTSVDANGDVDSFGNTHTLRGVVTSPDFREGSDGVEFSMTDGTGSIWVYTPDSSITYMPMVGDSVIAEGRITMSSGVARLSFLNNLFQGGVSSNYDTTLVTGPLGEAEEAELIRINNLSLQGLWDIASGSSFNVNATDGSNTYDIRIDANRDVIFNNVLTLQGSFDLVGIGSQYDPDAPRTEGYQILPRFDTDFSLNPASSIGQVESIDILAFPIPASSQLTVMLRQDIDAKANYSMLDLSGKQIDHGKVQVINGFVNFDVSNLTKGQYILTLDANNTTFSTDFMVQ